MTMQQINIGNIANDGTGDDLREAFIKVNQNFQSLELVAEQVGANLGSAGAEVYAYNSDNTLNFRRLVAGSNIGLTQFDNTIQIQANIPDSRFTISTDAGSIIGGNGIAYNIYGGDGVSVSGNENTKTITITSTLQQDTSPVLGASLDGNNLNITNVNNFVADSITSNALTTTGLSTSTFGTNSAIILDLTLGLINGIDYPTRLGTFVEGFDFGGMGQVRSMLEFVIQSVGVDMGSFLDPVSVDIDLGTFTAPA